MWSKLAAVLFVFIFAVSCTKKPNDSTPEGALESYITTALSVKQMGDKKKLQDLSTGEAREQLDAMSDEDFMKKFGDGRLRFISLKTKDKRAENDGGVSLVYEVTYSSSGKDTGPVTHKKIAYMMKDSESPGWRVRGTKNIKEFIEQKEPMVIDITK